MASPASSDQTTSLLLAFRRGDRRALDRLVPHLYDELHRVAHRELARRRSGTSMRTTELLHEAYLKLVDGARVSAEDRAHFMALAATTMRHIIIDEARRAGTRKRGGGWSRIPLDDRVLAVETRLDEILQLDEALARLERFDARMRRVVECRFFGGMTVDETAAALDLSPRTVDRAWQKARAWLLREIDAT